jgi:hypothetical protein
VPAYLSDCIGRQDEVALNDQHPIQMEIAEIGTRTSWCSMLARVECAGDSMAAAAAINAPDGKSCPAARARCLSDTFVAFGEVHTLTATKV